MSKKDLLERITRAPSEGVPPRREDSPTTPSEAVQTRVSRNVVRRRKSSRPDGSERVVVTRRRREEPPPVEAAPPAATPTPPQPAPVAKETVPAVVPDKVAAVAVEASPAPKAKPEVAAAPTPAVKAVEAPATEKAAPVLKEQPVPAKAKEAVAAAPAVEATPPPVAVQKEKATSAKAASKPAEAKPSPKDAAGKPAKKPTEAAGKPGKLTAPTRRFPGLGSAVVVPPQGYDPENPMAYRRQQDRERQAQAAPAPAATATPARGRTRRRVEPGVRTLPPRGRRPSGNRNQFGRGRIKRRRRSSGPKQASPMPAQHKRKVRVDNVISVKELANQLGVKATLVIRQLMDLGVMANITQMLDMDTTTLVANEFGYEVENVGFQEENYLENQIVEEDDGQSVVRPPVVTIMGHVDHGKTTLLDAIRKSRVAAGEAGGITQHVGAYQVEVENNLITFLDTPGHEAFTAMRARGAQVTDIVVLVVAADDGVQPQTIEAINHAKAAGVPIIVAVNKMDKPGVTAEAIMTRVSEFDLVPEEWGGDTMFISLSALRGDNVDGLLESILLLAEMRDLRANPDSFAEGLVIEAKMERGRGAVASVLVQKGSLKRGEYVVLGSAYGRVRAMLDYKGKPLKVAGPSTPVELFGLSELPEVGDTMNAVKSEKNARTLAEHRGKLKRELLMSNTRRRTAEDLYAEANAEAKETLHLIIKTDVGGTLQALRTAIEKIDVGGAEARILHSGVGDVTESDVNLASANNALIFGFNTKLDAKARKAANEQGVEPEFFKVIYDVLDRITRDLKGMLAPVYELVRRGTVEVRQLFHISKVGTVAGSYVIDGKVGRNHHVKVLRGGKEIWEGKVATLRRFKDDVKEIGTGFECGLVLAGFNELEEGDLVETYSEERVEVE